MGGLTRDVLELYGGDALQFPAARRLARPRSVPAGRETVESRRNECYDVNVQKAAPKVLELNLFENGVDFIRSAIEDYFLNDTAKPAAFKYAVLHMYAGVLLLLNERIRREAPLFVFKANKKTLNFSEIQSVLPSAGVTLQATDLKMLKKFQERRNVRDCPVRC